MNLNQTVCSYCGGLNGNHTFGCKVGYLIKSIVLDIWNCLLVNTIMDNEEYSK